MVVAVEARRLVMPIRGLPPAVLVPAVVAIALGRAVIVPPAVLGLRPMEPVLSLGAGHAHTEQQREQRCAEADESGASHWLLLCDRSLSSEVTHSWTEGRP